ncbi:MAG: glycosyltransferase [Candidatus Marinimicrobia bacterium]|nr:glycosyltransferase [Candidatus Neomarinimicrobiota bacterium]
MLKILYISPENTVGILSYWKKAHEINGNYCRFVTFYKTSAGYENDILLNLPLIASKSWYLRSRKVLSRVADGRELHANLSGYPPVWNPPVWQKKMMEFRELIWRPKINHAIREYNLEDFDVYHFEWGLDFFRNAAFAKRMKARGKKIVCHYHGQDMRNRGVIPDMEAISDLNLTNELDLLYRHPNLKYLFLPYDVKAFEIKQSLNRPLTICHATTHRIIKGSDRIIAVCKELEKSHGIRFIFIENQPHAKVLELKRQADIYIDQIGALTWGYGMNSLEALSIGLVCVTSLNETYESFIPDHPFVNANGENLKEKLIELIEQKELLREKQIVSREWVEKHHDYRNVVKELYQYYEKYLGVGS